MSTQRPEIRKGRKYDQVLSGAQDVFLRDGFSGASVDDIARAANVSKATLYSYFPDKRQMFMEMARVQCAAQADAMLQEIDQSAPAADVLTQTARGVLQLILSEFGLKVFRICVAEADRFPELGRRFYESGPAMGRQHMVAYLQCATEKGELKVADFDMAAWQFQELCKADLYMRMVFGVDDGFSDDEVERVIKEAVTTFMARYGA